MNLYDIILNWREVGLFSIVLPFILIFTITFALLEKLKILGDNSKVNVAISFVIGLLFLQNDYLIIKLQTFLPEVSFAIVVILIGLLIIGAFMGEHKEWSKGLLWIAIIIAVLILLGALSADPDPYAERGGLLQPISEFFNSMDPTVSSLIIALVLFLIFVGMLTKRGEGGVLKKLGKEFKDMYNK